MPKPKPSQTKGIHTYHATIVYNYYVSSSLDAVDSVQNEIGKAPI